MPRCATTPLSLRDLVDLHSDFVWRTLRRSGLQDAAADDATQYVFLIAAKKHHAIEVGHEKAFLYRAAMNIAARFHRTTRRHRETALTESQDEEAHEPSLDELLERRQARELLDDMLSEMDEPLRAVFVLVEIEEMTMTETAQCLGIKVGTVVSRLRRARASFERISERVRLRRLEKRTP